MRAVGGADCGQRYLPLPRAHSTHILSRRHILHVHIQMISECRIWHYMCVVWAATTQQESSLFIYYMLSFPICNFMTDFMFVFLCIVLVCRSPRMPCSACWWAAGRSVTFATKRPSSIQEAIDRSWRKLTTIKIETKNTNTKMAGKSGFLCDASNNNNHSSQTYTVKREVYLSTIRGYRMAYFQARSSSDWRNSHTVACDCLCVWSDKPNDNDDYDILYYYCATAARAIAVYEYLGKMGHTENISTQSYWRTTNVACHFGIWHVMHTRKTYRYLATNRYFLLPLWVRTHAIYSLADWPFCKFVRHTKRIWTTIKLFGLIFFVFCVWFINVETWFLCIYISSLRAINILLFVWRWWEQSLALSIVPNSWNDAVGWIIIVLTSEKRFSVPTYQNVVRQFTRKSCPKRHK